MTTLLTTFDEARRLAQENANRMRMPWRVIRERRGRYYVTLNPSGYSLFTAMPDEA